MAKLSEQILQKQSGKQINVRKKQVRSQTQTIAREDAREALKKKARGYETFMSSSTYETYDSNYNSLPADVKQFYKAPSEVKATPEYQKYQTDVATYNKQKKEADEWNRARKLVSKGKGWVAYDMPSLRKKVQTLQAGGYGKQVTVAEVQGRVQSLKDAGVDLSGTPVQALASQREALGITGMTDAQTVGEFQKQRVEADAQNLRIKLAKKQADYLLKTEGVNLTEERRTAKAPPTKLSPLGWIWDKYKTVETMSVFGGREGIHKETYKKRGSGVSFNAVGVPLGIDAFVYKYADIKKERGMQREKTGEAEYQEKVLADYDKAMSKIQDDETKYFFQEKALKVIEGRESKYPVTFKDTPEGDIKIESEAFKPLKSTLGYELEKYEGDRTSQCVIRAREVSLGGLKIYGEYVGIGYGIGVIGKGFKWTAESLGLGMKIGKVGSYSYKTGKVYTTLDMSTKTSWLTKMAQIEASVGIHSGTVSPVFKTLAGAQKIAPAVAGQVAKGALIGGIGGLVTYKVISDKARYKQIYGEDIGNQVWRVETGALALGLGTGIARGVINKRTSVKLSKQQAKINKVTLQKARALEVTAGKARIGQGKKFYTEVGQGKSVLSQSNQRLLSKQYSKMGSVSEKEALKVIREKSIYKQTLKIKSQAPTYDRLIHHLKTGKWKTGGNTLTFERYGLAKSYKLPKGVKTVALEWRGSGSKISNIGIKTSVSKGKYSITKIWERARYSPKLDMRGFRLKEVVVSKGGHFKIKKMGGKKVTVFELDNRLVKRISGKNFLKLPRVTQSKIMESATQSLQTGKPNVNKKLLKELYKYTGKEARMSKFSNIRVEEQLMKQSGIKGLKIGREGEYVFRQAGGSGQGHLPTDIGKYKSAYSKQNIWKEMGKRTSKAKDTFSGMKWTQNRELNMKDLKLLLKEKGRGVGAPFPIVKTKQINFATTRAIQNIKVDTGVRIKDLAKYKTTSTPALTAFTLGALKTIQKQDLDLGAKGKIKGRVKQPQKSNMMLKQAQSQSQLLKSVQASINKSISSSVTSPYISSPRTKLTPIDSPRTTPFPFIFRIPRAERKKKKKAKKSRVRELKAYLPDFTSRALGLAPVSLTQKQAKKRLNKMMTGLEIRRSVKLK